MGVDEPDEYIAQHWKLLPTSLQQELLSAGFKKGEAAPAKQVKYFIQKHPRNHRIAIRMSRHEFDLLSKAAQAEEMSVSEYIRHKCLITPFSTSQ